MPITKMRPSLQLERENAIKRYENGQEIASRQHAASYGDGGFLERLLCQETGYSARQLYLLRGLAEAWRRAEFEAILDLRMPNGKPIPISFLMLIAQVADAELRSQLIELLTRRALSHRQLASEIGNRQRSGNGRVGGEE